MKIRTIIVDDEYLARQRLLKLLEAESDIVVVRECKNGKLAIESIREKEPELIFLDIQMPDMNGFEVLAALDKPLPNVIFTTAYDQYAIKAFEIHAVDYLLKPFDEERLSESIKHLKEKLNLERSATFEAKMMDLVRSYKAGTSDFLNSFIIKEKGREMSVLADDVIYMEAQGNYVKLVCDSRFHMYRISMNKLESEMDPSQFMRIHRTLILNTRYINKYQYDGNNEYLFKLKNGSTLTSGRTYKESIDRFLETRSSLS